MVHRRNLHDDGLGVGEPLNEPGLDGRGLVVRGLHRLIVSRPHRALSLQRPLMERIAHTLAPKFTPGIVKLPRATFSALKTQLPENLHLVTLDGAHNDQVILRIGHMYAVNEDATLSSPVTISLTSLFVDVCVEEVLELNLAATQAFSDMKRRHWRQSESESLNDLTQTHLHDAFSVTLKPMQIKTWQVRLSKGSCASRTVQTAVA